MTPAAKDAVVSMGFPESLVQLAIDIRQLDHGITFHDVTELYIAAEDLSNNPMKQAECCRRLHEHAQKQQRKIPSPVDTKPLKHLEPPKSLDQLEHPAKKSLEENGFQTDCASVETNCTPSVVAAAAAGLSTEMSKEAVCKPGTENSLHKKVLDLARENQHLKERKLCRACRKVELATSGITFLPCGHFITCEGCSEMFDDCPACGKNIMGTVRTFLS
jgi:hypothetical protein